MKFLFVEHFAWSGIALLEQAGPAAFDLHGTPGKAIQNAGDSVGLKMKVFATGDTNGLLNSHDREEADEFQPLCP